MQNDFCERMTSFPTPLSETTSVSRSLSSSSMAVLESELLDCSRLSQQNASRRLIHATQRTLSSAVPLADSTANLPPNYTDAARTANRALGPGEGTNGATEGITGLDRQRSVPRSSKYPRVAVLLGVNSRWYIPLLLCRALSVTPAVWWALPIVTSVLRGLVMRDGIRLSVLELLEEGSSPLQKRISRLEIILAFLWVRQFLSCHSRLHQQI